MMLLIAAGPTHEPLDAVRYIANRSSGRMGLALAEAGAQRGFTTTLLLGPTPLPPPSHPLLTTLRFETTADLQALLAAQWPRHRVLIMAAAVADYRLAADARRALGTKRPRSEETWTLKLQPTPDLLGEAAAARRPDQTVIGFALDPENRLLESARRKLAAKNIDAIVANPLETIGADRIRATLLLRDGRALAPPRPECSKREFAEWLLDRLAEIARHQV